MAKQCTQRLRSISDIRSRKNGIVVLKCILRVINKRKKKEKGRKKPRRICQIEPDRNAEFTGHPKNRLEEI